MSAGEPWVVAVAALIFKEGRVLAMRRAAHKDAGAGLWETLSGRVEAGEQPYEAVVREIAEECGLGVEVEPLPVDAYVARRNAAPMVVIVFRAAYRHGEVKVSEEHDEYRWLTPEEFAATTTLSPLAACVAKHAP